MPLSPRIKVTYPAVNKDNWYNDFVSMVNGFDAALFANREDRNLLLTGGGTVSFDIALDVGTLTWDDTIDIVCPSTGFFCTVAANTITLEDRDLFYVQLVRAPLSNTEVAIIQATNLITSTAPDDAYLIGYRKGTLVYFHDGYIIGDGESGPLFTATTMGAAVYYDDPPSTINAGDSADPGAVSAASRGDHQHAVDTAIAGDLAAVTASAANAGVSTKIPRADHKHTITTAAPGAIQFGSAVEGVATSVARSDHTHSMASGTPVATGTANSEGTSPNPARVDHVHRTLVAVENNGSAVGSRPTLNFSSDFSVADNGGSDRIDISFGFGVSGTSGEALTTGQLVSFDNSGGNARVFKSDADDTDELANAVGICLTTVGASGNAVRIATIGTTNIPDAFWDTSAPVAADIGKRVFMSATAGNVTITAPSSPGQSILKVGIISSINVGSVSIAMQIGDILRIP